MSLENVKSFYKHLADNEAFRDQIKAAENKEECSRIVKEAGFDFSLEEYEEYTYQLLESANSEDEIQDLGEKELAAVFGGITGITRPVQPKYGGVRPPQKWPPIQMQPMYGVVIGKTWSL
ncbi:MAG: Nif11-like leader peptide family natural product precursor [Dolichospermum sp.]|jgi:predicted ribosomally synthesized peptide with nif11-like leader|nr:Nif11-like leader peptide family natural product precursor [Anabaena sp. 49628_E55]